MRDSGDTHETGIGRGRLPGGVRLLVLLGVLAVALLSAQGVAQADKDAYSLKWAAADPTAANGPYSPTYAQKPPAGLPCPAPSGSPGRAADPLKDAVFYAPPANTKADSVSSLPGASLTAGQVVPFELEVTAGAGAGGRLRINPYWLAKTTSGDDFGFDPSYGVLCAFVDTSDALTDTGSPARVSSFGATTIDAGTKNERILGGIDIAGADPGDHFIVEIWVVLKSVIPAKSTGVVQTGIDSATDESNGDDINVGGQTVSVSQLDKVTPPVTPVVRTNASPGGVLGSAIRDTATLSGGPAGSYTGTLTFKLFWNNTCAGTPTATVTTPVTAGNGSYDSPSYTPAATGTYWWVATFSSSTAGVGDSSPTACNDPAEQVTITPVTPTLKTTASAGGPIGTQVRDTATLSGGLASGYIGILTFRLFSNDTCSGSPVSTVVKAVNSGDGSYDSAFVTPAAAGTYYWVASFASATAGVNNVPAGACNDPAERVVIDAPPATPTLKTTASAGGLPGTSIKDTATLAGGPAGGYTGTLSFKLYPNNSCSGAPVTTLTKAVTGNGSYDSPTYTPAAPGTYFWVASFASTSSTVTDAGPGACNDPAEKVVIDAPVTPTLTTSASAGGPIGTSVKDTATLAGGPAVGYPGTLTFKLYDNASCSGAPVTTSAVPVTAGNGSYDSGNFTPATTGTYWWVASFTSSTAGVSDSDPATCNDPAEKVVITPKTETGGQADLEIHKVATKSKASPGENVPYVFTVRNNGPDVAHHVTITDALPHDLIFVSADPRCSYASGLLTCDLGTLPPDQAVSVQAVLQLAPSHTSSAPPEDHLLDVQKVEEFHAPAAGQSADWSLRCPTGYAMTDAGLRTDSVDQLSGPIDSVKVGTSRSDPSDAGRWLFHATNQATGQAQMHAFGVCVGLRSSLTDGHTHGLRISGVVTGNDAFVAGRHSTTLSCPAGSWAIAPGFEWVAGAGTLYRSEPSTDGRSWTFGFEQAGPGTVATSIRCLDERTTTDSGHFEVLRLTNVDSLPGVPPADMSSSQPYRDLRVSCPNDAKGIVGSFDLPDGVDGLGSTPEPVNRDFRLLNTSGADQQVHLDLLCLGIRIGDFGNGGSVTNTAWVFGDEADTNSSNDISSFVLEDPPAAAAKASTAGAAKLSEAAVSVPVRCTGSGRCRGTATAAIVMRRTTLQLPARAYDLAAGRTTRLRWQLSAAAKSRIAGRKVRRIDISLVSP